MSKSTSKLVAAVCGADTRLGARISQRLTAAYMGVLPRPTCWCLSEPAAEIEFALMEKSPSVVFNCVMDPDGGELPFSPAAYVRATQGMLSYCQRVGAKYIHVSSARLYGPDDSPMSGDAFTEYDVAVATGNDPWRPVLAAAERQLMLQTMLANSAMLTKTDAKFGYYAVRLGHVVSFDELNTERYSEVFTLSEFVQRAIGKNIEVICDRPGSRMSPLSADFAADCLADLAKPTCLAPYGFYNIGSADSVSLRELCLQLARKSGCMASFASCGDSHAQCLHGFDSDQAVCSDWWVSRGMRKVPSWKAAFASLSKQLAKV
jgi:nucleoside-diphosphate-sugar epimerase